MARRRNPGPKAEDVAAAVRAATAAILEEEPNGILAVNDGRCEDLAQDVLERLGVNEGPQICMFEISGITDEDGDFDRKLLSRRKFAAMLPPPGLHWEDMDDLGICGVAHIWLWSGDRHYDCDAPDGVENPFDLPLMRRCVAGAIRETRPDDEERLAADPWWKESFAMHDELVAWREALETEGPSGP